MPYSIDRQIFETQARIKKERKKLAGLMKKKQDMIVKKAVAASKKEIAELVKSGKSTEEILSRINGKK